MSFAPGWPAPANVRAWCSTRTGGVSIGAWNSLNLGDHVGDAPAAVAANRARLRGALGGDASSTRPVFLRQVHGCDVVALDVDTPDGHEADGCVSTRPGLACTVMVADCLPVLLTDRRGAAVAAAHAGWRGLADGVLERTYEAFRAAAQVQDGSSAIETIAWLGPCIGPGAFEVGAEVRAAFEARMPDASSCFRPAGTAGKWLADLPALARQRLRAMGVEAIFGNDGSDAWCTVGQPSRFFSHRRDGVSGRFAALVWKV